MVVTFQIKETIVEALDGKMKVLDSMAKGSGNSIPHKVVQYGLIKARQLAPHDTGATQRAIQVIKGEKGSKLRLHRPLQHRKDGKQRDYHLWMHSIGKFDTYSYIKSGDGHFMYTTADLMKKYAKELAAKEIKREK